MFKGVRWIAPTLGLSLLLGYLASPTAAAETGTVTGKVTTAAAGASAGGPVADAKVTLWTEATSAARPRQVGEAKTDAEGVYTLSDVAAGRYTVSAEVGSSVGSAAKAGQAKVVVKADETAAADIQIAPKTNKG